MCVFFPFILDIKFVGRTRRGHTGGRSHRISHPPSFCGACLNFSREKDSAIALPRRPRSRTLCTNDLIVLHPLGIFTSFFSFSVRKIPFAGIELTSQRVRGYVVPLSYRGDLTKSSGRLFYPRKNCFVTPYTIFMVLGTPTRRSISYRFRGSPSLITPHPLALSNYASASSLFWKSIGSSRFPNILLVE